MKLGKIKLFLLKLIIKKLDKNSDGIVDFSARLFDDGSVEYRIK